MATPKYEEVPPAAIAPLARLPEEWSAALKGEGGRSFHGAQIFRWIHARGVTTPEAMSDLPKGLREKLAGKMTPAGEISDVRRSSDHTRKLLIRFPDGATVETVLIPGVTGRPGRLPSPLGGGPREAANVAIGDEVPLLDADALVPSEDEDEDDDAAAAHASSEKVRVSQCISTQVGCAMGCVFCASGVAGLKRHLGADEIALQVLLGRARLDPEERLSNVVFMGMGEPLHNYEATARALRLLTHPEGIGLSARRVTISTSGLIPEIERLGKDFQGNVGLAISLHAADDETRSRLMPINKKYPLKDLMSALRAYPLPKRRRITIEYTLVAGKNDTAAEARKLVTLLRGLPVKINLIPMNPIEASPLGPPRMDGVLEFQQVICDAGYSCFIRRRRGDDVAAACGQLALLGAKPKVRVSRE